MEHNQNQEKMSSDNNTDAHSGKKQQLKASKEKKQDLNYIFNIFAKKISEITGNAISFVLAVAIIITWAISGYFVEFSNTWQLVINTATTVITFLIVFLIQNTQNRDTKILNLKIDELIKANRSAKNKIIDLQKLTDSELKDLEEHYQKITNKKTGS